MEALTAHDELPDDALALARCAAIAARIEPALLRALRFELLPHADVSAEADVWWSDFVDLRAADAVRFSPRALEGLYAWLTARPELAHAAYRIVRRVHRDASPFARLQEWLSFRALITPRHPAVARTLAAIVGTIVRGDARRDEAAAWAVAALPRLPPALRELPAFWSLAFAANRHGRALVALDAPPPASTMSAAAELVSGMVASADPVEIELGRAGDDLLLRRSDRPPTPGGLIVPDLSPLVLAVDSKVVVVDGRAWTPVRATSLPITIETIDGSLYELHTEAVARDPRHSVGELVREDGSVAGVAYLVQPNLAVTAGPFALEEKHIVHIAGVEGVGRNAEVISIEEHDQIVYLHVNPPVDRMTPPLPLATTLFTDVSVTVLGGRGEATDGHFTSKDTIGLPRPNELRQPYNGAPIVQGDLVVAHVLRSSEGTAPFCAAFLVRKHLPGAAHLAAAIELVRDRKPAEDLRRPIAELKLDAIDVARLWASTHAERRWAALVAITERKLVDGSRIVREALHRGSDAEREEAARAMKVLADPALERSRTDFAVVIGLEHYLSLPPLHGAADDARQFRDWLCDPSGGGLDDKNVRMILSDPEGSTTQDQIDEVILELMNAARAGGGAHRLYFYFSGHGAAYQEPGTDVPLLLPRWSTSLSRLALSLQDYIGLLCGAGLFEEAVFFIDCTRSASSRTAGVPPTIAIEMVTSSVTTHTFIALAGESKRPAYSNAGPGRRQGIFTRSLLSILRQTPGVSARNLKDLLEREAAAQGTRLGGLQRAQVENGLLEESSFGSRAAPRGSITGLRCAIVPENARLAGELAREPWLELVEPTDAEVRLEQIGDHWVVTDAVHGTEPGLELVALTADQLDRARDILEHYFHYALPLRMAEAAGNPGALQLTVWAKPTDEQLQDIKLSPGSPTPGGPIYQLVAGRGVCFEVGNASKTALRVTLVNSAASGKVQILGEAVIAPDSSHTFWSGTTGGTHFVMNVPAGKPQGIDRLTVLGTTALDSSLRHLRAGRTFADVASTRTRDIDSPEESYSLDEQFAAARAILKTSAK